MSHHGRSGLGDTENGVFVALDVLGTWDGSDGREEKDNGREDEREARTDHGRQYASHDQRTTMSRGKDNVWSDHASTTEMKLGLVAE